MGCSVTLSFHPIERTTGKRLSKTESYCLFSIFFFLFFSFLFPEGFAGLSVTYGLTLNMLQMRVIWFLCEMENEIISVERIFQYTCIPSEPALVIEETQPDHSWPSHGEVDFRDLQVSS